MNVTFENGVARVFTPEGVEMAMAKIIAHSVSEHSPPIATIHGRYPRMVHADAKTHRVVSGFSGELLEIHEDVSILASKELSRNGRSSRAVPVKRLLEEAPYVPHFMRNKPGMVASEELSDSERAEAEQIWMSMVRAVRSGVTRLNELGVHKQWTNRPLEWCGYIDVLITSTDWANYFALRDEESAQPEVQALAKAIKRVLAESTPNPLKPGEWHLPYVTGHECELWIVEYGPDQALEIAKKISVARCARLTIEPFDGNGSIEAELIRYERLMVNRPVHASPAEHQATPDEYFVDMIDGAVYLHPHFHGNFFGWNQNRKMIPHECVYDKHYSLFQ